MPHLLRSAFNLLVDLGDLALAASVLLFLPLAVFKSKRKLAGAGLKCASFVFLLNLWAYALAVIWMFWGPVVVIVGVVFTPIVAALIAAIAAMLHKDWHSFFATIFYVVITLSAYAGGDALYDRGEVYEMTGR